MPRRPRPDHLKALEGEREDRRNRHEPIPEEGRIVPPVPLPDAAQAIWDRLAPDLIDKRALSSWDVDLFCTFCRSVALYNRAAAQVEADDLVADGSHGGTVMSPAIRIMKTAHEMMSATGQRFGLTPGDRAALKVDGGKPANAGAARLLSY